MNNLIIGPSKTTPGINFIAETGVLELSGTSYPEDPFTFYEPVVAWIVEHISLKRAVTFYFKLDYYNTSSAKQFLDIIDLLEEYHEAGGAVEAVWFCKEGDSEALENGLEFFEDMNLPNKIITY